jgi:hypothetical protein
MSNVIPLPNEHAPVCGQCRQRMRLAAFHPDPNGGRYMFERFRCSACTLESRFVRAITVRTSAPPPAVCSFPCRDARAPAAFADAPEPSRFG